MNVDHLVLGARYVINISIHPIVVTIIKIRYSMKMRINHGINRLPGKLIDPYPKLKTKSNYRREFWASKGLALSSFQLKKVHDAMTHFIQQLIHPAVALSHSDAIALIYEMNQLFLRCRCLEDERALAILLYEFNPGVLEVFLDLLSSVRVVKLIFTSTYIYLLCQYVGRTHGLPRDGNSISLLVCLRSTSNDGRAGGI